MSTTIDDIGTDLEAVQEAVREKEPQIPAPPDCSFSLPGGYVNKNGEVVRQGSLRELTGEDEEAIAKILQARNIGKAVTELVTRSLVSLGDEKIDKALVQGLSMGDREYLVLRARIITYGNELEMKLRCPNCGVLLDVVVDLENEIPVREFTDEDILRTVDISQGSVVVGLPTGGAHEKLGSLQNTTIPEMNTLLLANAIRSIGEDTDISSGKVRRLSAKDRQTLIDFVAEHQPGPDYTPLDTPCSSCTQQFPVLVKFDDLFRNW